MTRRSVRGRLLAGIIAGLAGVVAAAPAPLDDLGRAVRASRPATRIVSLLPSLTESVCALGGCDRLVGTDRYSNWPAAVAALPKLGGIDDAQVERIVALKPDLVLATASARVTARLEALGLHVVVLEPRNRADVERALQAIAVLLGTPDAAGRLWAQVDAETNAAARRVPTALRGQRVYFEVDSAPYAAGAGSFIGETLSRLGLGNVVPAALGPFPKLNPEFVVRAAPDIVMATRKDLASMGSRPGWGSLRALQNGHRCGFAPEKYELLIRPGPRLGEAAGVIADCLVSIGTASTPEKP